ncbi:TetR/AcrR family transcriptional regulator [Actinocorallia populi]|uniref:TetR/AcrR family transcriptional regulator n=1 Tax=Actinocorallia populi TaxID=2079200 RepID=UPI000D0900A4|nr:TetR/AcrR family transcriptional regulator [Actinocorallia populi]
MRDAQKCLTRERLIDAAFEAFHRHGYQATNASVIAKAAGASRATFYLHFSSKAEIVIELLERIEPSVLEIYERLDELEHPSLQDVRDWVADTVAWWERDRLRFEAFEQALAVEPRVAERWYSSFVRAAESMTRHLSAFSSAERDAERLRIITLMAQLDRTMYFTTVQRVAPADAALLDVLAHQWHAALHRRPSGLSDGRGR